MLTRDDIILIARHIIDGRGRADRRAMAFATVALLAIQFLLAALFSLFGALDSTLFMLINLPLLWIGVAMVLKRLHDIGWSGWWIFAAIAFWIVGSVMLLALVMFAVGPGRFAAAMASYPALHGLLVVLLSLPPFGGLLWLQACPGMTVANRFGGTPGLFGLAAGLAKSATDRISTAATAPA